MILYSILLIALLIAAAAWIVVLVFKPKWPWLRKVAVYATALTCTLAIGCSIGTAICHKQVDELRDEAQHIMLYYNTVNYSTNEYVRFDFYQEVKDYNARYTELQEKSEDLWIGAFYPDAWDSEIGLIDFMLNGGEENGFGPGYNYNDEVSDPVG